MKAQSIEALPWGRDFRELGPADASGRHLVDPGEVFLGRVSDSATISAAILISRHPGSGSPVTIAGDEDVLRALSGEYRHSTEGVSGSWMALGCWRTTSAAAWTTP